MTFEEFENKLKKGKIHSFVYLYNTHANPNASLTELFVISRARYIRDSYIPSLSRGGMDAIVLNVNALHMDLPIETEHIDLQSNKFEGFIVSENEYDNGFVLVGDRFKRFKKFLIKNLFGDKTIKYVSLNDVLHFL